MAKKKKTRLKLWLSALILLLVLAEAVYLFQPHKAGEPVRIESGSTHGQQATTSAVNIALPEDLAIYRKQMTEFVQVGGIDPLPTTRFIVRTVTIPFTDDLPRASIQAATSGISLGGGPAKLEVLYLKVLNGTAYVLLNIDEDGWAGVSVTLAIIHPIVEKTLLQFPDIQHVVFGYAPEDAK